MKLAGLRERFDDVGYAERAVVREVELAALAVRPKADAPATLLLRLFLGGEELAEDIVAPVVAPVSAGILLGLDGTRTVALVGRERGSTVDPHLPALRDVVARGYAVVGPRGLGPRPAREPK